MLVARWVLWRGPRLQAPLLPLHFSCLHLLQHFVRFPSCIAVISAQTGQRSLGRKGSGRCSLALFCLQPPPPVVLGRKGHGGYTTSQLLITVVAAGVTDIYCASKGCISILHQMIGPRATVRMSGRPGRAWLSWTTKGPLQLVFRVT